MSAIAEERKCDGGFDGHPWDIYTSESLDTFSLKELISLTSSLKKNYALDYTQIF